MKLGSFMMMGRHHHLNLISRETGPEGQEVWEGEEKNKQVYKNPTFDFEEGDKVRILRRQSDFKRSGTYMYQWSKDIYSCTPSTTSRRRQAQAPARSHATL
jgi:hypothetical protein